MQFIVILSSRTDERQIRVSITNVFFPYSLKVKELIRAPENSCLLSFVFFLLKNQHVKKTYTEAIQVNICRKDHIFELPRKNEIFLGFNFTAALVVSVTSMISHVSALFW